MHMHSSFNCWFDAALYYKFDALFSFLICKSNHMISSVIYISTREFFQRLTKLHLITWNWYFLDISNIILAIACRLRSTVGNIKKGRWGVLMVLKLFQFYFRQLLVIRNTYFVENNGMKKKKKRKKKRMRTLFQSESL